MSESVLPPASEADEATAALWPPELLEGLADVLVYHGTLVLVRLLDSGAPGTSRYAMRGLTPQLLTLHLSGIAADWEELAPMARFMACPVTEVPPAILRRLEQWRSLAHHIAVDTQADLDADTRSKREEWLDRHRQSRIEMGSRHQAVLEAALEWLKGLPLGR